MCAGVRLGVGRVARRGGRHACAGVNDGARLLVPPWGERGPISPAGVRPTGARARLRQYNTQADAGQRARAAGFPPKNKNENSLPLNLAGKKGANLPLKKEIPPLLVSEGVKLGKISICILPPPPSREKIPL